MNLVFAHAFARALADAGVIPQTASRLEIVVDLREPNLPLKIKVECSLTEEHLAALVLILSRDADPLVQTELAKLNARLRN